MIWARIVIFVAVLATIGAGYVYVKGLQDKVSTLTEQIALERHRAETAETLRDRYLEEHGRAVERLQALEKARRASDDELDALRAQIRNMTLEEDFARDANDAVRNLNARNAELNRLLERESGARDRRR